MTGTCLLTPRHQRGPLKVSGERYGSSALGAPLLYFPAKHISSNTGLILAGTHGDEAASIVVLSCALRTLLPGQRHQHLVLCVNPDGCQLGLRANANGVDLNRNFPHRQRAGSQYRLPLRLNATCSFPPVRVPVQSLKPRHCVHRLNVSIRPGLSLSMNRLPALTIQTVLLWPNGFHRPSRCRRSSIVVTPPRALLAVVAQSAGCPASR